MWISVLGEVHYFLMCLLSFLMLKKKIQCQQKPVFQTDSSTWVWLTHKHNRDNMSTATHSSILAWRIPMDRGAWRATVHRVAKCQTELGD